MTHPREIVFIDSTVSHLDTLLAAIQPGIETVVLSGERHATAEMADLLLGRSGLEAIHVIAHGQPGEVSFGSGAVSLETLDDEAADLGAIGSALGEHGQLLLWSCGTGEGKRGATFVDALARAVRATVSAATGLVGSAELGGRWELDLPSKAVTAQVPLTTAGRAAYCAVLGANKIAFDLNSNTIGSNGAVEYVEQGTAIFLAANATVTASGNFHGLSLTVSGLLSGDVVSLATGNGISISGSNIFIGSKNVGSFSGGNNPANFVIIFTEKAGAEDVASIIHRISYFQTSDSPVSHSLTFDLAGLTVMDDIKVIAVNDAAIISGTTSGAVLEAGGVSNATLGTPTATGTLTATDVDNPADTFQAVAAGASSAGGYGTYAMTAGGVWAYTLDNGSPTVQALNETGTLTDTFTVHSGDGTAMTVTVTINGANDAAVIADTSIGAVTEAGGVANGTAGTPTATGTLTASDVDNTPNTFMAVAACAASTGGYGTYEMAASGTWIYTLDDASNAVQALNAGGTLTDHITVQTVDGTAQVLTITITGSNDAALISGTITGAVIEAGGVANGTLGTPTASGTLTNIDMDDPANTFQSVAPGAASSSGYGTYAMTAGGAWTYTLDEANEEVEALNTNATLTDTITVTTVDGTQQLVTVSINGSNDAAIMSGTSAGAVIEAGGVANGTPGMPTALGRLTASDVDNTANTFVSVAEGATSTDGCGTYEMTAGGVWSYTLDNANAEVQALNAGATLTDTFTVTTVDGTEQLVTVTINGTNDAAVITGTSMAALTETNATQSTGGKLSATDPDNSAAFMEQTAMVGSNNYGKFDIAANGAWTYTMNSAHDEFAAGEAYTDSITVATADGSTQVITVSIAGTNDGAVIAAGGTLAYTENQASTAIVSGLTLSDVDSGTLTGATVSISANFASGQDVLGFVDQNGITGSYEAGVLTLSGSSSVAHYQTALRSVTYFNSSDNPSAAVRSVSFQVDDGAGANHASNIATSTVTITAVNEAPINIVPGAQLAFIATNFSITGLAMSDVDVGSAANVTSTLSVLHGTLTVLPAGGAVVSGNGTAAVTLTGTVAQINTILAATNGVVYKGNIGFAGVDMLTMLTNDGGNTGVGGPLTDTDTVAINVQSANPFALTTGTDTVFYASGANSVTSANTQGSTTLNIGDKLTGGAGADSLTITDTGTNGLTVFSHTFGDGAHADTLLTNFESVLVSGTGTNNGRKIDINLTFDSFFNNNGTLAVSGDSGLSSNINSFTIEASAVTTGAFIMYGTNQSGNVLRSGAGSDTIRGGSNADTISGGRGADTLTGGLGADVFIFNASDSGQTNGVDVITDYMKGRQGTGDQFNYGNINLTVGGSSVAATANQASINAMTGVTTFAGGSGANLADALADIALSFQANATSAGEFSFFRVNNTGNYYLFISDGVDGVGTGDVIIQLQGINTITRLDLSGSSLSIIS